MRASSGERSPSATIASSWRAVPAGRQARARAASRGRGLAPGRPEGRAADQRQQPLQVLDHRLAGRGRAAATISARRTSASAAAGGASRSSSSSASGSSRAADARRRGAGRSSRPSTRRRRGRAAMPSASSTPSASAAMSAARRASAAAGRRACAAPPRDVRHAERSKPWLRPASRLSKRMTRKPRDDQRLHQLFGPADELHAEAHDQQQRLAAGRAAVVDLDARCRAR